jgi:pyruvate dehydrogenase E2 component (dihydrolipoamide acetyltransferase)
MAVEIVMPKLSDTMTEGALVTWFVAEGERVEVGQVLAEIETDKSSVDLEATAAGVVARIVVAAGSEGVAVGEVLVLIEEGAAPASRPSTGSEAAAITATGASTGASGKAAVGTIAGSDARPTEAIVATGDGKGPAEGAPPASVPSADGGPAATPLARRMAAQAGLDLASLAGSGARAKITKVDIERALGIDDRRPAPMPALARAAGAAATPSAGPGGPAAAESSGDAPAPVAPRLDRSPAVFHDEAPSRTRAVIAERLAAAKREVPHFYLSMDVDARRLLKLRKRLKKENP